jgi:hypothetical protein
MVTTVPLRAIRRSWPVEQRLQVFHALEHRFARQACVTTALVGASGSSRPALDDGVTTDEIAEIITHLAFYSAWPCGIRLRIVAARIAEAI